MINYYKLKGDLSYRREAAESEKILEIKKGACLIGEKQLR